MKTLSLKLDDHVFEETEQVVAELNLARNRYINEALTHYNQFNKRQTLKKKLPKESRLVQQSSTLVCASRNPPIFVTITHKNKFYFHSIALILSKRIFF